MSRQELEFHFSKAIDTDTNEIPASILVQSLDGLQRTVHLLAKQHEGASVTQRDRISAELAQKYPIMCAPLEPGCVLMRTWVGDPLTDLFAPDDIQIVTDNVKAAIESIARNKIDDLSRIIPDYTRRKKVIDAVKGMLPKRGSNFSFTLKDSVDGTICQSTELWEGIKSVTIQPNDQVPQFTVTGRLAQINFDDRKLTIIYPPTQRTLECIYDESIEDMLLENPREMIQVTGSVIMHPDDTPEKIVDVISIEELDLSPFYVTEVPHNDGILKFRKQYTFNVTQDESKQLLLIEKPELGVDIIAYTRDELDQELMDEISDLWSNYAERDEQELTPDAIVLRKTLLNQIELISK